MSITSTTEVEALSRHFSLGEEPEYVLRGTGEDRFGQAYLAAESIIRLALNRDTLLPIFQLLSEHKL
jgi:hypothetical protein